MVGHALPVLRYAFPGGGSEWYLLCCYCVRSAAVQVVGPSGGGMFSPVYFMPFLGPLQWGAARVGLVFVVSSMWVASSSLWGHLWSLLRFCECMGRCLPSGEE